MQIPIKRYLNRKLYNTLTKRYITIKEICALIQSGEDIIVSDATSGEDITSLILSQVIMERERNGERTISEGFLTGLIRASNDTLEAVGNILRHSPDLLLLNLAGVPTREDINKLNEQIDYLSGEITDFFCNDEGIGGK